jgi:hypothetical protein
MGLIHPTKDFNEGKDLDTVSILPLKPLNDLIYKYIYTIIY